MTHKLAVQMGEPEKPCTLLICNEKSEDLKVEELRKKIEKGPLPVITAAVNGEKLPQLLIPIIKNLMPLPSHVVKKLMLLYWEVVDKTDPNTGKLRPDMILACNSLRNDLLHASEYVRGSTLRFLCRVKEPEILEPLIQEIQRNLEHRHAYVRRNAVLALYSFHRNHPHLVPNAPEIVANFLSTEGDAACKRNAFIMLASCSQDLAVAYLDSVFPQIGTFGEILQFIVVELVRKICRADPGKRPRYMKAIFVLLGSTSSAVRFEAAITLAGMSSAPASIKAAASTLNGLVCTESDNNVKLVVLDRLEELKTKHPHILKDLVMDILRALSTPTLEIRRKALDIALDLVTSRSIDEVISLFKKELNKTAELSSDKAGEYRQMIVQAIHTCATRFPEVASQVVHVLVDYLGGLSAAASDVVIFVREVLTVGMVRRHREVLESYPHLRKSVLAKMLDSLPHINVAKVWRTILWVLGEYAEDKEDIEMVFSGLHENLRGLSALAADEDVASSSTSVSPSPPTTSASSVGVRVLSDGTYASQSALAEAQPSSSSPWLSDARPALLDVLVEGDSVGFLHGCLAVTLTKLVLRAHALQESMKPDVLNRLAAQAILTITQLLRLGSSRVLSRPVDVDSKERLNLCISLLVNPSSRFRKTFLLEGRRFYGEILGQREHSREESQRSTVKAVSVQADDLLKLRVLQDSKSLPDADEVTDLEKATGFQEELEDMSSRLDRVVQLTGYSDPLYAEACLTSHHYNITLELFVFNQTRETVQNLVLELATMGALKLVERPPPLAIAPGDGKPMTATIKVSSTDAAVIFGSLVYEIAGQSVTQQLSDRNCVILNEIRIDIMDYIVPATCSDLKFRQMWCAFEWENKIVVNTAVSDPVEFLDVVLKRTNMSSLTPPQARAGDCGILCANLFARSVFGEDVVANFSVEKENDRLVGFIRIRAKTQGFALSLGEKVVSVISQH